MNESTVEGPMECEDCGRVCQGIQGIRGHRRACPGRKQPALNQRREPVVEPGSPVVQSPNQQITLGSRLNVEGVDVVLRLHEQLRALLDQLRDSLPIRRSSDSYDRAHNYPTYEHWFNLGRDIVRITMAIERILQQAYISRDEPWILYQLAIKSRNQWVSWRREEAVRTWKKRASQKHGEDNEPKANDLEEVLLDFGIPELERDWERVVGGLRWLTAHTRATLY